MHKRIIFAALAAALAFVCQARATVNAPYAPASYACNGTTTVYTISFPYLATSHIVATSTTAAGAVTSLALGTDYAVSPPTAPVSGAVTLVAGSRCPSGSTLTVSRVVPLTQPASLRGQGPYQPATLETALDRLEMQLQNLGFLNVCTGGQHLTSNGSSMFCSNDTGASGASQVTLQAVTPGVTDTGNIHVSGAILSKTQSGMRFADQFANIQAAITDAGTTGAVTIPSSYAGSDTFTNPNSIPIIDLRGGVGGPNGFVNAKALGACGNNVCDDRAALQAAITATPDGGTLVLPNGAFKVCVGLPLLITKSIHVVGYGWSPGLTGSLVTLCNTASNTTDVFLVQPTGSSTIQVKFSDFAIFASDGVHGRYGVNLDGASGEIAHAVFDHMSITSFAPGRAINASGSGLGNGTPALSNIERSLITGGISMSSAGDQLKVADCNFASDTGKALDVSFIAGSSTFLFKHNLIVSDGGIHVGTSSTATQFIENEFETNSTFTGSNGSFLDLDGTSGSHVIAPMVVRNSFQIVNGITTNGLRLNYVDAAYVVGNRFGRGLTTSKDVAITANATDAYLGPNMWVSGGPYTSMVSDLGTRTIFLSPYPSSGLMAFANTKSLGWLDDIGTARSVLNTDINGTVNLYGYHGQAALAASNGAVLMYDSNGGGANIVANFGSATSSLPVVGTIVSVSNLYHKPFTFATLPTPSNFMMVGCSDCTIANPCAGGGTGAFAKRLNGVWVCN